MHISKHGVRSGMHSTNWGKSTVYLVQLATNLVRLALLQLFEMIRASPRVGASRPASATLLQFIFICLCGFMTWVTYQLCERNRHLYRLSFWGCWLSIAPWSMGRHFSPEVSPFTLITTRSWHVNSTWDQHAMSSALMMSQWSCSWESRSSRRQA